MKKYLISLVVLLTLSCGLSAAESQSPYLQSYLLSYPHTIGKAALAPLHWDAKSWLTAGGTLIVIGSLYLADDEIKDLIQRNRSPVSDDISAVFKQFGEGKYVLPAVGLKVAGGYLTDSKHTVDTGMLCLKSFLLANAATQTLKLATQRNRPVENRGKQFWLDKDFSRDNESFPSGHVTVVWSVATILAGQYGAQVWVAPVVYGTATLTGLSRMNDNKHWASDVFAGAVIGYVTGRLVLVDTPRLQVYPDLKGEGIGFSWRF
jgi:hypothetical protein